MTDSQAARDIDTSRPHSARMYDYYLGGKDHFEIDKQAAERVAEAYPAIFVCARENRAFMHRVTRVLAREHGIRQWLDIGTGIPTEPNLHQVAQSVVPDARVVYADNDPLVLAHARILLTSSPEGVTNYIDADLRDPEVILAQAGHTLDLDQPIALLLIGVLGHVDDYDEARSIVRRLLAGLPSGSFLVQCDGTDTSAAYLRAIERYRDKGGVPYNVRSPEQIAGFYEGLELVEPGVVAIPQWRPEPSVFGGPTDVDELGGVGRKA